jgi:hypothetical protein
MLLLICRKILPLISIFNMHITVYLYFYMRLPGFLQLKSTVFVLNIKECVYINGKSTRGTHPTMVGTVQLVLNPKKLKI